MPRHADEDPLKGQVPVRVRRLANGWWKATFPEIDGAEASGRSLTALRRRRRETLRLSRPDIARVAIVEELRFRRDLMQMVADVIQEREELEAKRLEVQRHLRLAVKRLRANGLSVRDAAHMLGISTAYVQILGRVRRGRPPALQRPGRPRGGG